MTAAAELTAFRLATWRRPLRTEPSRVPGRYHAATDVDATQYLCLHPLGPWAEFLRGEDLREADQVRQRVWALRLRVRGLARIGFAEAAEHGVRPGDLVSDDHRACRRLAARLRERGVTGAIVPSAALPGTDNVVLFGARVSSPWTVEPLGPVDLPAGLTADMARPPASLVGSVRFRGEAHRALEAWRAGEAFEFSEPSWAVAA